MKIYNTTTNRVINLTHPMYDTDIMGDIIGNHNQICNIGALWPQNEQNECLEMSGEDINWWSDYVDRDCAWLEFRAEATDWLDDHGHDAAQIVHEVEVDCNYDIGDMPGALTDGLKLVLLDLGWEE